MAHQNDSSDALSGHYREKAHAARALAAVVKNTEARKQLWGVADDYEFLGGLLKKPRTQRESVRAAGFRGSKHLALRWVTAFRILQIVPTVWDDSVRAPGITPDCSTAHELDATIDALIADLEAIRQEGHRRFAESC